MLITEQFSAKYGMSKFKILTGKKTMLVIGALAGVKFSTTDKTKINRYDKQCKRSSEGGSGAYKHVDCYSVTAPPEFVDL